MQLSQEDEAVYVQLLSMDLEFEVKNMKSIIQQMKAEGLDPLVNVDELVNRLFD